MGKYGTPMYKPSQHCKVSVLVQYKGQPPMYKTWRSKTGKKAIMAAARKQYPGAKLTFGCVVWHTD